ncbi:hypothetical protein WR25_10230 [Diploscapter pachys]|uniref:Uncharacterized protein n=1 Tax=Diploscapter pachys TaxID=2018661 RepID=A0A2A2L661_9BILA|nr:hypothetical protein WR25_10230 [Diploscapter pachys]
MVYIGIDLGTTYSCVSVIEDGKPVAICSDDGKFTIPSVVAYCSTEILVGSPALAANTDISNVLYDSKRLIGYKVLNDALLSDEESFLSFRVETRNRVVGYILNAGQENERFLRPEEVSAEILKKLKTIAERYLPETEVTGAVVTVPAFFNNDQIDATKRAIQMAGLDLKYLLEEPTAAAIAYYNKMRMTDSTIMVFDWGGGTLAISIAEIKNEKFDVKSVCGDAHLGGQNFDERIMKYAIEEFKKSNNYDMLQRPNLMKRLRQVCKEAKESLSFQIESWNVKLDINYNTEINVKISRSNFNQLCKDLFDKAMRMVERALRTAQISAEQINYVILVGGSTRIPKIQELLSNKFGQPKLRYNANPEVAIVHGAAIIADALEKGIEMPLIVGAISTSSNAGPTKNEQITSSNPIELKNIVCIGIDLGTTYSCVSVVENGKPIIIFNEEGVVVAIPAFFQTAQIEATKRAVQMAELELKMLVKEPTAAAIAYNEDKKLENSNIMIFDFGGGTLDINICKIENGKLAIKAVHGDDHLDIGWWVNKDSCR